MQIVKAAAPMHWFGHLYEPGDPIDTTGYDEKTMTRLLTKNPVYVTEPAAPGVTLQAGENVTIDDTDPAAPIISVAVPSGTTRESFSGVSLGSHTAAEAGFTYYAVPAAAQRGLVSRLVVTPSGAGSYDLEVRNANDGTGERFLQALGASGAYDISSPFYFENDTNDTLYIGVRNTGPATQSFTLTTLRVERFV